MTGVAPDELVELRSHEIPPGADYLWEWFLRLTSTRPVGFGVAAISEQEIHAFFENRRIIPTAWEIDLLVRMDGVLRETSDEDKNKSRDDVNEES